jgi:hypothetical protein
MTHSLNRRSESLNSTLHEEPIVEEAMSAAEMQRLASLAYSGLEATRRA